MDAVIVRGVGNDHKSPAWAGAERHKKSVVCGYRGGVLEAYDECQVENRGSEISTGRH